MFIKNCPKTALSEFSQPHKTGICTKRGLTVDKSYKGWKLVLGPSECSLLFKFRKKFR